MDDEDPIVPTFDVLHWANPNGNVQTRIVSVTKGKFDSDPYAYSYLYIDPDGERILDNPRRGYFSKGKP